MYFKIIGALMIITGCGGFGFYLASTHKKEELLISRMIIILDFMECELQYRMTPLPMLCKQAADESSGILKSVFLNLSFELDNQISPDVSTCMHAAIKQSKPIPKLTLRCLQMLGSSLGRFDLQGQLQGLHSVRTYCTNIQKELRNNKDSRIRSYQTLSLCAGAALAILLL